MKRKFVFGTILIACNLILCPSLTYAGNGNDHNGNGQGTGQGSGNVPVPADQNNIHGRVNNGDNYNNGVNNRKNAEVPFDGGLTLLIAAGIGVRVKKAYDNKKRQAKSVHERK